MDINHHLIQLFKEIFEHLNTEKIKAGVDKKGLDPYIHECATLAGGGGLAAGTLNVVGIPVELANNVLQQFRVTAAVIYARRGGYGIDYINFEEFMKIVGASLGVEVGFVVGAGALTTIATVLLAKLAPSMLAKPFPGLNCIVGAVGDYLFIRSIGKAVKAIVQ